MGTLIVKQNDLLLTWKWKNASISIYIFILYIKKPILHLFRGKSNTKKYVMHIRPYPHIVMLLST